MFLLRRTFCEVSCPDSSLCASAASTSVCEQGFSWDDCWPQQSANDATSAKMALLTFHFLQSWNWLLLRLGMPIEPLQRTSCEVVLSVLNC